MAARVQKIALERRGEFTVDEIAQELVKSSTISPSLSTTPGEYEAFKKQVSNNLSRMVEKGLLVRVKNGVYRRAGEVPEPHAGNAGEGTIVLEPSLTDPELQWNRRLSCLEANRMKPPETPGEPLPIRWPLELEEEAKVFAKTIVVGGGVTNSGKTLFAMDLARLNMEIHNVTYINSEMSEEELADRLQRFGKEYGIPWQTFYDKVFFAECPCNALNSRDMGLLADLLDPEGINIIDYIKIHENFYKICECLDLIHAQLNHGIAIVFFFRKTPEADHLLGKSFPQHLARLVMMIDIDKKTGLRCLRFTKVKAPAKQGDRPEKRPIWFSVSDGVRLEWTTAP
jgi:hypothetical protein